MNSDLGLEYTASAASIILGGGEMGKLVRATDWSRTPLGPLDSWPQSLRTTVNLGLASNFPISIAWGPQRNQIYNDGYWPICGTKHPQSFGQDFKECWFSAWPAIGEAFEQASAGQTAFLENRRMFLDRNGYLEETFFTFTFSPIRDESGGVGGLFHPVTELTQHSLGERRLKVLRDLADCTARATSVEEAARTMAQCFARCELDLPFVLLYLVDADGRQATLAECIGMPRATPASPPLVDLQDTAARTWQFMEAGRLYRPAEVSDLEGRFGAPHCGPYPETPQTAFILPVNVPGQGHPLAFVVAGVSARRPLDEPYRVFYQMLGQAVSTALVRACVYQQERKRAESLAELDRAKTAFFSNVSHEFRTPLTLLLGPLEDELRENSASRARLEPAHRNCLRLLKLVNTLLDFSRLEAGRIEAIYQPVDLAAFTADLASVFRSAIEKAGLRFVVDCRPLPEPVYVDREMYEKIVLNLLSNAFKFTLEGEIGVALRWDGAIVELSVSDTGVGIRPEELPRLFERFHRVQDARARSQEGTGIGLALVQELTKLHGGEVQVRSTEGRGTTFTVALRTGAAHLPKDRISAQRNLASTALGAAAFVAEALRWLPDSSTWTDPYSAARHVAGAAPPTAEPASADKEKLRVLLADDNADMRDYLCNLLGRRYNVLAVADGEAALTALRQEEVDLLITDVMMPRLDGFGLLRAIRSDPLLKTMPVILLSARAGEECRIEGLDAGADDYVVKPFSALELLSRVGACLAMARIRREADAAVRRSEKRHRRLFETAQYGILLLDRSTLKITDANPSITALLGCSHSELIGKESWQIGLFQNAETCRDALEPLLPEGHVYQADLPLLTKSGVRQVEFIGGVYEEDGAQVIQCNIRDISERKEMEQRLRDGATQLEAANRELETFAYSVSHDLRAPLRGIEAWSAALVEEFGAQLDEEARHYLNRVRSEVQRMGQLIEDLLRLSRVTRAPLERGMVDITVLARRIADNLQESCDGRRIEFCIEPELAASGDASLLEVALTNLLNNAAKFTGKRDVARVEVGRIDNGGLPAFYVRDNGAGFDMSYARSLFAPFQRLHRASDFPGSGIGLATVQRIIHRHGGRLWAEAQVDRGATFYFTLAEK